MPHISTERYHPVKEFAATVCCFLAYNPPPPPPDFVPS
jgi:hypothetical protein